MRFLIAGLLALVAVLPSPGLTSSLGSAPIDMQTGGSRVITVPGVVRVAVGDPAILGVLPLPGKTQLLLNARKAGRTSLIVWVGSGAGIERDYQVTVTMDGVEALAQMIRSTLRTKDVRAEVFGRAVMVKGAVADGSVLQGVSDVLARFEPVAKQENATIINTVVLARPLGELQAGITSSPELGSVRADPDGVGNVIVSGRVRDETQRQLALREIRGRAGRFLSAKGEIIDRLTTELQTQINVKVRILEIDDTGLSQLGARLQSGTVSADSNGRQSVTLGPPAFPLIEGRTKQTPFELGPFFRTILLAPTIDLMVQTGHARLLSEPNLTTTPGQEATFLVGGQIPIPQGAGLGQISIVYQNYGVQLKINPTVLSNGDIETKIAPEVSDLDFQDGVLVGGFAIPALKTSRISTNLITAAGESIVMGGMLRHIEQRTIEKIPLLSQLPFFGKLFQSVRYQRGETNVIFVMTPQLIVR